MIFEEGLFSSAYAGSVRYYAAMLACRKVMVHAGESRHKASWSAHHCRIVGANGEQTLTLPLVKPLDNALTALNEIIISEHGDWRRTHWGALFSAYGRSPFFEYIADDLLAIYEDHSLNNLWDFNMAIHRLVVDFMDLPIDTESVNEIRADSSDIKDFRGRIGRNIPDSLSFIKNVSYWQVWQERHGFKQDLSIFDLLMTHGRESVFILRRMLEV